MMAARLMVEFPSFDPPVISIEHEPEFWREGKIG
jgi:hypothetical protein